MYIHEISEGCVGKAVVAVSKYYYSNDILLGLFWTEEELIFLQNNLKTDFNKGLSTLTKHRLIYSPTKQNN